VKITYFSKTNFNEIGDLRLSYDLHTSIREMYICYIYATPLGMHYIFGKKHQCLPTNNWLLSILKPSLLHV